MIRDDFGSIWQNVGVLVLNFLIHINNIEWYQFTLTIVVMGSLLLNAPNSERITENTRDLTGIYEFLRLHNFNLPTLDI